jgi:hypothetical protein
MTNSTLMALRTLPTMPICALLSPNRRSSVLVDVFEAVLRNEMAMAIMDMTNSNVRAV